MEIKEGRKSNLMQVAIIPLPTK